MRCANMATKISAVLPGTAIPERFSLSGLSAAVRRRIFRIQMAIPIRYEGATITDIPFSIASARARSSSVSTPMVSRGAGAT